MCIFRFCSCNADAHYRSFCQARRSCPGEGFLRSNLFAPMPSCCKATMQFSSSVKMELTHSPRSSFLQLKIPGRNTTNKHKKTLECRKNTDCLETPRFDQHHGEISGFFSSIFHMFWYCSSSQPRTTNRHSHKNSKKILFSLAKGPPPPKKWSNNRNLWQYLPQSNQTPI